MKTTRAKQILLMAGACLAAAAGWGSDLRRADVAADPAWVLHLDVDRLRSSAVGQHILSEMEKPEAQAKLAALQAVLNFDLRKQLHAVTLYGTTSRPEDGVLMIYGDIDQERLMTLAKAAKDYKSTTHKGHVIHNWIDENKKPAADGTKPRVHAAIHGMRVVFGQQEAPVARALDVLDGGSNLGTSSNFPRLGAAGNTSFIQGAVRKIDLPDSDPNAAMFKLSNLIMVEVGEAGQQINATLTLSATDEEVAKNISLIAQGVVALLKLQKDKPEAARLANALAVKLDGKVNTIALSLPSSELIEIMKADAARKAEKAQKAEVK